MEGLYRDFPVMNVAARILIQRCYLLQNRRIIGMWMQNAARRLEWFQKNFPGMYPRVSGKYLASYLGMTASMLSRLKKNKN
jgi:CRP/FNR family transcriptional regulator, anaerobic regulatory protein